MQVIGIDVGGTKVEVAVLRDGQTAGAIERPTPLESADALLDGIEAQVRDVIAAEGEPGAIGVGVPSQIDFATGTVVASVNIPLQGVPLKDELERRFGVPVYVDNDANVAGLAEAHLVEDGPARHLLMLTLGTGVGGGIVIDGHVFRGASGLGAELGHMVIDANGRECPGRTCHNRGCIEGYCSGSALEVAASEHFGKRVKGREVVDMARGGDEDALRLIQELGTWLGVGISSFVNIFEPEHVVIGGGLSRAADLFLDTAIEEARRRALPAAFGRTTIGLAKGGADAGVIGAGLLALNEYAATSEAGDTPRTATVEGVR